MTVGKLVSLKQGTIFYQTGLAVDLEDRRASTGRRARPFKEHIFASPGVVSSRTNLDQVTCRFSHSFYPSSVGGLLSTYLKTQAKQSLVLGLGKP